MSDQEQYQNDDFVVLGATMVDTIQKRILHTLQIYPKLSHSMLQVGIGTGLSPALWHPVLDKMVQDGRIVRHQVKATNPVTSREQEYTIIEIVQQAA